MSEPIFIGIDLGSTGVRGCALDSAGRCRASAGRPLAGEARRDPQRLLGAARSVLRALAAETGGVCEAIAIDGTSGSFVALGKGGAAAGPVSLYSDRPDAARARAARAALPPDDMVGGSVSVLGRLLGRFADPGVCSIAFEADFVASALAGRRLPADLNSALKAGADPSKARWADWLAAAGLPPEGLPEVVAPGTPVGRIADDQADALGFRAPPLLVAGTTDGCASALAAGLARPGDAVTSLGTTLTLKIFSDRPVSSAAQGIYSHRILGRWLVGGASNAGGEVLRQTFGAARLAELGRLGIASAPSGLAYVPLVAVGERFPVSDPGLAPCLEPRPADEQRFFQAILDSLVQWEKQGYRAIRAAGGPHVRRLAAVGGGTRNAAWMQTRARDLRVPSFAPLSTEPAFGAARLARSGATAGA